MYKCKKISKIDFLKRKKVKHKKKKLINLYKYLKATFYNNEKSYQSLT